jgi:lysophospholipase L1-like esterase
MPDDNAIRLPVTPLAVACYGVAGLAGVLAAISIDQALRVWRALRDAESRKPAMPYQYRKARARRRVLIVGDSTGVGVGAERATDSVGGLIAAEYRDAELINLSVGCACLADVPGQLRRLAPDVRRFDLVLLHVGGNDVMRTANLTSLVEPVESLLLRLRQIGRRVVWLGPGDVGLVPLFRPPFSWWLSRRTRLAADLFHRLAQRHGVEYLGFHAAPHRHMLTRERAQYFASDGLHPSSHGYLYAYGCLQRRVALAEALGPPATSPRYVAAVATPPAGASPGSAE